jgi:hypothetical protein
MKIGEIISSSINDKVSLLIRDSVLDSLVYKRHYTQRNVIWNEVWDPIANSMQPIIYNENR